MRLIVLISYSRELQRLHDERIDLKRAKAKMQADLRKKFGSWSTTSSSDRKSYHADAESLLLVKSFRLGYLITVSKKSDIAKVNKARAFEDISETSKAKFVNNVGLL